jgi:hypothetical protein
MNTQSSTYTRDQAMAALGITSPSAFHHLRRKYPGGFVVVKQGNGRTNFTLYDKTALDKFIAWRKVRKLTQTYSPGKHPAWYIVDDLHKKPKKGNQS